MIEVSQGSGSRVKIYDLWANLKKIARKRFMIFLVLLGPESNISKVGQNWAITNGLNVTSKKMAAVILKKWLMFSSVRSTDLVLPIYLTKNAVKLIIRQCIHHSEVSARIYK